MSKASASSGGDRADQDRQHPPVEPRDDVLGRDGGRVDVGERLVDLDDDQHGQRDGAERHGQQRVDHVEPAAPYADRASTPSMKQAIVAAP